MMINAVLEPTVLEVTTLTVNMTLSHNEHNAAVDGGDLLLLSECRY